MSGTWLEISGEAGFSVKSGVGAREDDVLEDARERKRAQGKGQGKCNS